MGRVHLHGVRTWTEGRFPVIILVACIQTEYNELPRILYVPDYNLYGLAADTFEQLVQAIATKEIAAGTTVYGSGPDGGRDASFEGRTTYPSKEAPWDGYVVVQAKFRKEPFATAREAGAWVNNQLEHELQSFDDRKKKRRLPDYYLLVTNVDFSAVPETGTLDRVRRTLTDWKNESRLKDFDVWDGNKIRRLLDSHREIAQAYGGFITAGDVLAKALTHLLQLGL